MTDEELFRSREPIEALAERVGALGVEQPDGTCELTERGRTYLEDPPEPEPWSGIEWRPA